MEIWAHGYIPLLSTRYGIPVEGDISDARGAKFHVVRDPSMTWLYPERPLELPVPDGVSSFVDRSMDFGDPTSSNFNLDRDFT